MVQDAGKNPSDTSLLSIINRKLQERTGAAFRRFFLPKQASFHLQQRINDLGQNTPIPNPAFLTSITARRGHFQTFQDIQRRSQYHRQAPFKKNNPKNKLTPSHSGKQPYANKRRNALRAAWSTGNSFSRAQLGSLANVICKEGNT